MHSDGPIQVKRTAWVVNIVPLMCLCVALDALCIWAEPALLVSVYEQLYEQVAALLTENDGEALNSAIDWANCSPSTAD